jgi:hypothetical protein
VYSKNDVEVTLFHQKKFVLIAIPEIESIEQRIKSMDKLMLLVEALEPVKQSINNEEGD